LTTFAFVSLAVLGSSSSFADDDVVGCAVDRPCFSPPYQQCHRVVFEFNHVNGDWNFYNVRHQTANGEQQFVNHSGVYTIDNAKPSATYTIKAQGCKKHYVGHDRCSPWEEASYTTVGDSGPETCGKGYVWRDAGPNDHVCVVPPERDKARAQNGSAAAHRQAGGGAYGPNTCAQGFVWREAFAGDQVCVIPDDRNLSRTQNQHAQRNKLCP
jgi:hypothetical protein